MWNKRNAHHGPNMFSSREINLNAMYFLEQTFECYRLMNDPWGRWPGQLIENYIRVQHYKSAQMVAAVTMIVSTFMFHDENHLHSIGVLVWDYAWLQIWELSTVTVFTSKVIIILSNTNKWCLRGTKVVALRGKSKIFHFLLKIWNKLCSLPQHCGVDSTSTSYHPANGTHATTCHYTQHFVINLSEATGLHTLTARPHWYQDTT